MDLGPLGVWWSGTWRSAGEPDVDVAAELERAGYGALWSSGGFEPGLAPRFARLLASTTTAVVASGIASIWATPADELARAAAELEAAAPGRFLLGIGASHELIVEGYRRPYAHMVAYLDALDAADPPVPADRRILAALGPKMLALAGERSAGAHPYFVPVEHTAHARDILGHGPLLAPEVTVVLDEEAGRARQLARTFTTGYLALPNYAQNLRSLGFSEEDLAGGGSDRLVDAVVAWGSLERVAARVRDHHEAGADHVCIQVVTDAEGFPLESYRRLAEALAS